MIDPAHQIPRGWQVTFDKGMRLLAIRDARDFEILGHRTFDDYLYALSKTEADQMAVRLQDDAGSDFTEDHYSLLAENQRALFRLGVWMAEVVRELREGGGDDAG